MLNKITVLHTMSSAFSVTGLPLPELGIAASRRMTVEQVSSHGATV